MNHPFSDKTMAAIGIIVSVIAIVGIAIQLCS
jgi:hypothetical protein